MQLKRRKTKDIKKVTKFANNRLQGLQKNTANINWNIRMQFLLLMMSRRAGENISRPVIDWKRTN